MKVSSFLTCFGSLSAIQAHMRMSYPLPRGEPGNLLTGPADYDLNSPLPSALMCKAKPPGRPTATFRAGETINVKFKGSARHGGGMCQFALSYDDDRTFIAIATVNGARPSGMDNHAATQILTPW